LPPGDCCRDLPQTNEFWGPFGAGFLHSIDVVHNGTSGTGRRRPECGLRPGSVLATGADAEQLGVVGVDGETDLGCRLSNDVRRRRRHGVHELTAADAQSVVVPIDATIETAGVVAKRQLQDDAVISKGVERVVNGAEGDSWQHRSHSIEDIGGARMVVTGPHGVEDRLTLGRHSEAGSAGRSTGCDVVWRPQVRARAHLLAST
jgi:hypothetical protein